MTKEQDAKIKLSDFDDYYVIKREYPQYKRILDAVKNNDQKELAYLYQFGDDLHHIISNSRAYEQAQKWDVKEINFDEYGWFIPQVIRPTETIKIIDSQSLLDDDCIYIGELNGLFTYAFSINYGYGGSGLSSYPSIWDEIFKTRDEAVKAAIKEIRVQYNKAIERTKEIYEIEKYNQDISSPKKCYFSYIHKRLDGLNRIENSMMQLTLF